MQPDVTTLTVFFFLFLSRVQAYYTNVLPIPFKHLHPSFLLEKKKTQKSEKAFTFYANLVRVMSKQVFILFIFRFLFSELSEIHDVV